MWQFLHAVSRCTTCTSRFDALFRVIARAIPCDACRAHALEYVRAHKPPRLCGADPAAFEYTVAFHNQLNQMHDEKLVSVKHARRLHPARRVGARARALAVALQNARPVVTVGAPCDDAVHCSIASSDSRSRTRYIDAAVRALRPFDACDARRRSRPI